MDTPPPLGGAGSGLSAAGGAFAFVEAIRFREMEHGVAEEPIRFGLITAAIGFEPGDDVGIETHGDGLLHRPVELADFGSAPIENGGSIREINVAVFFCGDGSNVSVLLFGELPHRLSFRGTRRRGPR
jgi:hypothetical protein